MNVSETKKQNIVVEEFEFMTVEKLWNAISGSSEVSNEFLPLDAHYILHINNKNNTNNGAVFSAKINSEEVARIGMFVENHQVIIGGTSDLNAIQNMEIRKALLAAVHTKSKHLGIRSASLYTPGFSLTSIVLYKTLGYYFSGKRKLINGSPLLHMEKKFD